jgi:hypothetical protein
MFKTIVVRIAILIIKRFRKRCAVNLPSKEIVNGVKKLERTNQFI